MFESIPRSDSTSSSSSAISTAVTDSVTETSTEAFAQIEYFDDSVLIFQPRFTDEGRKQLRFIIELPNGSLREVEKSRTDTTSKLVRDLFLQYSEAEIEIFTQREAVMREKKRLVEARLQERGIRDQALAVTFQAKVQALEIPEVKDHPDPRIARRIRRARNPVEVAAIVGIALSPTFALHQFGLSVGLSEEDTHA